MNEEFRIVEEDTFDRLRVALRGQPVDRGPGLSKGNTITDEFLNGLEHEQWFRLSMSDEALNEQLDLAKEQLKERRAQLDERFEDKKKKLQTGDDMAPGVLKIVKVYLAIKRRIQPGDKMAGRHGNKGVISIIMPVEDMPYDEEGNPVDIVLNPLGVPSRMNVGQVLETHLGAAARGLGHKINRMIESQKKSLKSVDSWIRSTTESVADVLRNWTSSLTKKSWNWPTTCAAVYLWRLRYSMAPKNLK